VKVRKARVFISNYKGQHLANLSQYGDVVNLTEGNFNVFDFAGTKYILQQKLKDFDPDLDFLALSGSNIISMALGMMIAEMFGNVPVNLLLWKANEKKYIRKDG